MALTAIESSNTNIYIISPNDYLFKAISEELNYENARCINVKNINELGRYLKGINNNANFYVIYSLLEVPNYDYSKSQSSIKKFVDLVAGYNSKVLFILPYSLKVKDKNEWNKLSSFIREERNLYSGIVYAGDIVLPVVEDTFISELDSILNSVVYSKIKFKRKVNIPPLNTIFCPLDIKDLVRNLLSMLFSMSPYGSTSSILGLPRTLKDIIPDTYIPSISENQKMGIANPSMIKENKIISSMVDNLISSKQVSSGPDKKRENIANIKNHLKLNLGRTTMKLSSVLHRPNIRKHNLTGNLSDKTQFKFKKLFLFVLLVFILLISPIISLTCSGILISSAGRLTENGNTEVVRRSLQLSEILNSYSLRSSEALFERNVFPLFYIQVFNQAQYFHSIDSAGISTLKVIEDINIIFKNLTSPTGVATDQKIGELKLELENLDRQLGFVEGEWLANSKRKEFFDRYYFNIESLPGIHQKIANINNLIGDSNIFLGLTKPFKLLVLFYDDSVVKPGGGEVTSVAILTIDNGEISDTQVLDNKTLSANNFGFVEPPAQLKHYFGAKEWTLKDVGWNPDFILTSQKAEWFIDKNYNIAVDGTLAVNEDALSNYKEGFVAGKLTESDIKSLLQKFTEGKNSLKTLKVVNELLNKKQILVNLHTDKTRKALNELKWDGSFSPEDCSLLCRSELVSLNEYSDKKGWKNIRKEVNLAISFETGITKKKLDAFYQNDNDFDYSFFVRLISGADSSFSPLSITKGDDKFQFEAETSGWGNYKEQGYLLKLSPHESVAVSFNWENPLLNMNLINEYKITFLKQAGSGQYPLNMFINISDSFNKGIIPGYSLTSDRIWSYNTGLDRNFTTSIKLKD